MAMILIKYMNVKRRHIIKIKSGLWGSKCKYFW